MQRLVLFAKRPRLGHVKTRLVPPLTAEQALELYRAFLIDQLGLLDAFRSRCAPELCLDEDWEPDRETAGGTVRRTEQGDGDLGSRMLRCLRRATGEGAERIVIVAADSPTLPATHVERAFDALAGGAEVVLAPAFDGGYVLIGLRRPVPELFCDMPWGGPEVLRITLERARDAGIETLVIDPWYDVDDGKGLGRLRSDLRDPEMAARAPATARALARIDG